MTITAAEVVEPVTLTSTKEFTEDHGTLTFAEMEGYPTDFDVTKFQKATYKVICYDASGKEITDGAKLGTTKVCVNCSSDKQAPMYNWGYGDGFAMGNSSYPQQVKNGQLDAGTSVFTLTCDTLSKDASVADCLTYQTNADVKKVVITEIKFE